MGGVAAACHHLTEKLSLLKNVEVHLFADNAFCQNRSGFCEKVNGYRVYRRMDRRLGEIDLTLTLTMANLPNLLWLMDSYNPYEVFSILKIDGILKARYGLKGALGYYYYLRKILNTAAPDVIHTHHAHLRPIAAWLATRGRVPIVVTLQSFSRLQESKNRKLSERLIRKNSEIATKIIAICRYIREQAIQLGTEEEKIVVIPNGIDLNEFYPIRRDFARKQLCLDPEKKMVLFVGNLTKIKGVDILVHAFKIIRDSFDDVILAIVGDGEEKRSLMNLTAELNLQDRVMFVGQKTPPDLLLWYNACDMFVAPSRRDTQPVVFLEAMACAKPVIGTNVGGVPEMIDTNRTGLLAEKNDHRDLAEKITTLILDDSVREFLGNHARRRVESEYSWKEIAIKHYNLYTQILRDSQRPATNLHSDRCVLSL